MLKSDKYQNLHRSTIAEAKALIEFGIKKCTSCNTVKSESEFNNAKNGVGGLAAVCKTCVSDYDSRFRLANKESLLYQLNRAILKRQSFGTHVCWLKDKSAHKSAEHLYGQYGLMNAADARKARAIFANNLPAKIEKLEAKAVEIANVRKQRAIDRAIRKAEKERLKEDALIRAKSNSIAPDMCDDDVEQVLYQRMQYHLKNKKRRGDTELSFTKLTFQAITGYTLSDLRVHLSKFLPKGCSWSDAFKNGFQIDHVLPSSAFDVKTVRGVRACYALSNLMLLSGYENARKGVLVDKETVLHFKNDPESARLFGLIE